MSDWSAWIGRSMTQADILTPAAVARLRATIGAAPDVPQGLHWCLCLPETATGDLDVDGHPKRGGFLPPVDLPRRMWAASEVEFLAAVAVGAAVERVSTIASVEAKSGGSGRLVFVTVEHATSVDGIDAIRERQTIVYREAAGAAAPPAATAFDPADWEWRRTSTPTEPLLFRYSALTFNSHRIHYDRPYATEAEGYRGLVVHGPLIATLLLDLCAQHAGPVARFAFRGQAPAIAGEPLHLVGRREGHGLALAAIGEDGGVRMSATATRR